MGILNEKLIGLFSKKLGVLLIVGWLITEMIKADGEHCVSYGWMVTIITSIYMIMEVVTIQYIQMQMVKLKAVVQESLETN